MRRTLALWLLGAVLLGVIPASMEAEDYQIVQLSFAGDTTLGGHEGWMDYSIGTFKVMAQQQEDDYFLRYAREIFEKDDFTLVNLEGVLADSAKGLNKNTKWNFRGETAYTGILTAGSVEGVTLGNNHTMDFGKTGLESTKAALDAAGIGWCLDQDALIFEKDGIKIAFLSFSESAFDRQRKWLEAEIPRLRKEEGCQAVVVAYHGGRQYWPKHRESQTEDMRFAVDCGADLVIGHHPHVLQGMEVYKDRLIVYSLGNFCYGGNRKPRGIEYPTMVLGCGMRFDENGFAGVQATIHPFLISGTTPRNNYQPIPAAGADARTVMDMLQEDTRFTMNPYVEGMGAVQDAVMAR